MPRQARGRTGRTLRPTSAPAPQPDLFEMPAPIVRSDEPEAIALPGEASQRTDGHDPEPEAPAPIAVAPVPLVELPRLAAEPVKSRDAFLYVLADRDAGLGTSGLLPDTLDPPILFERGAVAEALRRAVEDDATVGALACFRVRRYLVPELQDDPDGTARLGAPCYLFVGP